MSASLAVARSPPYGLERDARTRPVPLEYLGLARAFRRDILRVDERTNPALAAIVEPYQTRLAKKPGLRREQLRALPKRWAELFPDQYLLDRRITRDGERGIKITELRLVGSWWREADWRCVTGNGEDGITLLLLELTASTKTQPKLTTVPVASLSLHAIARWHERSTHRPHADLLHDLKLLAIHLDTRGDRVPASHGFWLGHDVVAADGGDGCNRTVRHVRTYIDREQLV